MIKRQTIMITESSELIKTVAKLTGIIPYSMCGFFPIEDDTMRHRRSELINSGDIERIKRGKYYFMVPSDELLSEDELVTRMPYQRYIENHEWSKLRSQITQIALLSGAEVRGLRIIYEPNTLSIKEKTDGLVKDLMGLLPKEEGEDDIAPDDILERMKLHSYSFPLFIDKAEYIDWIEKLKRDNTFLYQEQIRFTKVNGFMVIPGKAIYMVYFIDDIQGHKCKMKSEKLLRITLESELKNDVHGLFITSSEDDKKLLLKKKLSSKEKNINPKQIKPAQIFGDNFDAFCLPEAESIQNLIGSLKN